MHKIQEEIGLPKIQSEGKDPNHAVFTISPLPHGFGTTIAHAIKRVLLSALPGSAISAVKISGVTHEYATIKGVKESVMDIVLNLKGLAVKKHSSKPSKVTIDVKAAGVVTAKDIKCPEDVEILNPDLHIATLDKGGKLKVEIEITKGVGYSPVEERSSDEEAGKILVDADYSPVKKISYEVTATRVGKITNLDKISMDVQTNGSLDAEDAVKFAANVLKSYFSLFDMEEISSVEPEYISDPKELVAKKQEEKRKEEESEEKYTPIEILNLSPRTLNSLVGGGIASIESLVTMNEAQLKNLRGFGKKAMTEVTSALGERDLSLTNE